MKAVGMRTLGQPEILEIDEPNAPAAGEVSVAIDLVAVGVADVRALRGDRFHQFDQVLVPQRPFIFGFAAVGHTLGATEGGFPNATRVLLSALDTCGACSQCMAGFDNHCPELKLAGIDMDCSGFLRERVTVSSRRVFAVPELLTSEQACVASEVATALHALRQADLGPNESLVVVGAGRHGRQAMRVARLLGARHVAAVDYSGGALALAEYAGADTCYLASSKLPLNRFDVVLHANSDGGSIGLSCDLANTGGRVVLLGTPESRDVPIENFASRIIVSEHTLVGSNSKTLKEYGEALELMAQSGGDWDLRSPSRIQFSEAPSVLLESAAHWPTPHERFIQLTPERTQ